MKIELAPYPEQAARWPSAGKHVLAQYDDASIVVYQAYRPGIGHFAAKHGYFGGDFKLSRMSWIKPNFLWMAYRCGWATKDNQEVVLAVRLQRRAFDSILSQAVPSSFDPERFADHASWKSAVANSDVRLQWDPDHDPMGAPAARRALQIGLRGEALARYAKEWILDIEDVSELVREQHRNVHGECQNLLTPKEAVYHVEDAATRARLGLSSNKSED